MENVRYLSKEQVAALFEVSVSTINRYIKEGLLSPIKVGKFVRFQEDIVLTVKDKLMKGEQA